MPGATKDVTVPFRNAKIYLGKTETHDEPVHAISFARDNSSLATACEDTCVRIWNFVQARKVHRKKWNKRFSADLDEYHDLTTLKGHSDKVRALEFSPCQTFLVSGANDNTVRVWSMKGNLDGWSCVGTLNHEGPVCGLSFAPEGFLDDVAPDSDEASSGGLKTESPPPSPDRRGGSPRSAAKSPVRPSEVLFEPPSPKSPSPPNPTRNPLGSSWTLATRTPPLSSPQRSPPKASPAVFASASEAGIIKIWAVTLDRGQPTFKELAKPLEHDGSVHDISFSPSGKFLASGSNLQTIKIWDTATWECKKALKRHHPIVAMSFSPSGRELAVGDANGLVDVLDTKTWKRFRRLSHDGAVSSLVFSPHGNRLVVASNSVDVYTTDDWSRCFTLQDTSDVNAATFCASGQHLAVAGGGDLKKVRTFNMSEHLPHSQYTLPKLIVEVASLDDETLSDALNDLNDMIGLQRVKDQVASIVHKFLLWPTDPTAHRNVKCYGPPGVGKTHAAEIIARIFNACGMVARKGPEANPFVKIQSKDLIAQYTGQTDDVATKFLKTCSGKVSLFDEANTFGTGDENAAAFAKIAATCVLRFVDEHRQNSIMMVAGYSEEDDRKDNIDKNFFSLNGGLSSRFPNVFNFEPYTVPELIKILIAMATNKKWAVECTLDDLEHLFSIYEVEKLFVSKGHHSNARGVEHLFEAAKSVRADNSLSFGTLDYADIEGGFRKLINLPQLPRPLNRNKTVNLPKLRWTHKPKQERRGADAEDGNRPTRGSISESRTDPEIASLRAQLEKERNAARASAQACLQMSAAYVQMTAARVVTKALGSGLAAALAVELTKVQQGAQESDLTINSLRDEVRSARDGQDLAEARAESLVCDKEQMAAKKLELEGKLVAKNEEATKFKEQVASMTKQREEAENRTLEKEAAAQKKIEELQESAVKTQGAANVRIAELEAALKDKISELEAERSQARVQEKKATELQEGLKSAERETVAMQTESRQAMDELKSEYTEFKSRSAKEKAELETAKQTAKLNHEKAAHDAASELARVSKEASENAKLQQERVETLEQELSTRDQTVADLQSKMKEQEQTIAQAKTSAASDQETIAQMNQKHDEVVASAEAHEKTARHLGATTDELTKELNKALDALKKVALARLYRATQRTRLAIRVFAFGMVAATIVGLCATLQLELAVLAVLAIAYLLWTAKTMFWKHVVPALLKFVVNKIYKKLLKMYHELDPLKLLLGLLVVGFVVYAVVKLALHALMISLVALAVSTVVSTYELSDLSPDELHDTFTELGAEPPDLEFSLNPVSHADCRVSKGTRALFEMTPVQRCFLHVLHAYFVAAALSVLALVAIEVSMTNDLWQAVSN